MATLIFYPLHVSTLRNRELGGLTSGSIDICAGSEAALGPLGQAALAKLVTANDALFPPMARNASMPETQPITSADNGRRDDFSEWKRTVKTATRSSDPELAEAGKLHWTLLEPFDGMSRLSIPAESAQVDLLQTTYTAKQDYAEAAAKLGLTKVIARLWEHNATVKQLYSQRLDTQAAQAGPSATALKPVLVKAYNDFCTVMEQTLQAMPTPELQAIFTKMDELRRKFASRSADEAATEIEKPANEK